jgi:acyl-CoA hydrolase
MNWRIQFREKLTSPQEAVRVVRSHDQVYIHPGCATPEALVRALLDRAPELEDVRIIHLMTLGAADYVRPEYDGHFRCNALFIGNNVRAAIADGRADYTPVFLGEIEQLFQSNQLPVDVAFVQVSPPDEYGFMSLGVGVDCTLSAARCARYIVAEMNHQMPRTHGDCFLHVSKLNAIVETSHPLPELLPEPSSEVEERIAENVAGLIPDGATLQMGIGGIPNAVLSRLFAHKDLGIHTEMFSDGVIPLIEAGIINGEKKTLHRGKQVAGFTLGTRRLFAFIDNNPIFEFHTIQYVNDPFLIAQNERMVAINSAIEVDVTGQVCSDSIGTKPYSGFGGQVDFIRGAARSKGGKPIVALPSTAKNGTVSRIVAMLKPGAGVVTSRGDVHYVVTEHGVAYLHGKTLRERVESLISIADPKFREELYEFAYSAHYLRPACVCVG